MLTKRAKHADQHNFLRFVVETGGRITKQARECLDSLMPPPDPDPAPDGRQPEPVQEADGGEGSVRDLAVEAL
jgi:hypothetical protein